MTDIVESQSQQLTLKDVRKAFPSKARTITQEAVDIMNDSLTDPEFQGESLAKIAYGYQGILNEGHVSMIDYLNAIRYCAFLDSEDSQVPGAAIRAYIKTFFSREFVQKAIREGKQSKAYKALGTASSRYSSNRTVVKILTVTKVPIDILFGSSSLEALNVLSQEMKSAPLAKDRIEAAKSLVTLTKDNTKRIELEVGPSAAAVDMLSTINEQLGGMALTQQKLMQSGYGISEAQKTGLTLDIVAEELDDE